ncbi:formin-binding protein [Neonectria punicea]|uniref:Formin-binding protein n=1 Tax=Neonectria punicea TaxID=979145 RepID=A0ABR1H0G7_9HYPO
MPASTAEPPAVALSFANNFWGKDDAGVGPMLARLAGAKQTCDELRVFYGARASIEDEYARKLMNLSRKPLGTNESGTLKTSLDTVRGEVEQMAKQHQNIAAQMKTELEEPLAAFAGGMKERRKIVQNTVEKLLKVKMQQTQHVNKTRDKYEQECLKIKGYLAQGHMVMGQEERRNKAKLEKTQISLATSNTEYESAVQALEDTTARWNREWKAAADKFQDLEEERLDFSKSSLWTFANIASTVCVSDDSSCEKIRLSLETMDVEKDIITFITDRGTGQEIPDAPKYINFCRGDINDSQSEASEDDNYSVAQFPRSINPAFRSSSPQPSTFESHHDPDSALAQNLAHREPGPPGRREPALAPQKTIQPPPDEQLLPLREKHQQPPQQFQQHPEDQLQPFQKHREPPKQFQQPLKQFQQPAQQLQQPPDEQLQPFQKHREPPLQFQQPLQQLQQQPPQQSLQHQQPQQSLQQQPPQQSLQQRHYAGHQQATQPLAQPVRQSLEMRRSTEDQYHRNQAPAQLKGYDVNQHGPVAAVPHDPYPMDGMTMLCRTGPPGPHSDRSSQLTSARPSSRDSHSDYSNPTSFSSQEPPSGKTSPVKQPSSPVKQTIPVKQPSPVKPASPVKQDTTPLPSPTKPLARKKSGGFLKNHTPLFRRKSQKEIQSSSQSNRNTWHAASSRNNASPVRKPQLYNQEPPAVLTQQRTQSPEPIDANASLALGVGQNVFPVSNPDENKRPGATPAKPAEEMDPIALALAEIKGVTLGKQSSVRMSADHYHGISTPAPGSETSMSRSVPVPGNQEKASVKRGTPPPSYHTQTQVSRLGVPPPACTSKAMKEATKKATTQTRSIFGDAGRPGSGGYNAAPSRPTTRGTDVSRDSGSYNGAPSRSGTRATEMNRDSGSYSAAPSRSGTRATEMSRGDRGEYSAPPMTRSGTRGTDMASPTTRPGTRGSDMSRGSGVYGASPVSRPGTRGTDMPRATSPAPMRSASPQPPRNDSSRMSYRSASPNPPFQGSVRSPSQMSSPQKRGSGQGYFQQASPHEASRAPSPAGYRDYNRPQSSYGGSEMAVALSASGGDDGYGSQRSRGSRPESQAMGLYDGGGSRQRSKSVADPSRLYTSDGRPILHYARALYVYQAAIPEELGFAKGDYLAVLRHQDDGWWEAEVHGANGRIGLVPSNYLQPC